MRKSLPGISRGENDVETRPAHLQLVCQVNAIHRTRKPYICENHGYVLVAQEHNGERGLCALVLRRWRGRIGLGLSREP